MSKTKVITIACWSIVAIVLIGLAGWFICRSMSGGFGINIGVDNLTGPYEEVGSYSEAAKGIDSISVNWIAGEVGITSYEGNTIQIAEYARRDLKDGEKLQYKVNNGKLEIRYAAEKQINMVSKKLELLVPESLAQNLNQLNVEATSADLKVSGFDAASFTVHETSGNSEISDITSDAADVSSVSGTIRITDLTASELKMNTKSGGIELSGGSADQLTVGTTSGEVQLRGTFKRINAISVSGGINVAGKVNPDAIDCGTTSGNILIAIPGNADLAVSYATTSGRFTSEIPVITGGKSAAYQFNTVSGDIDLKELSSSF